MAWIIGAVTTPIAMRELRLCDIVSGMKPAIFKRLHDSQAHRLAAVMFVAMGRGRPLRDSDRLQRRRLRREAKEHVALCRIVEHLTPHRF